MILLLSRQGSLIADMTSVIGRENNSAPGISMATAYSSLTSASYTINNQVVSGASITALGGVSVLTSCDALALYAPCSADLMCQVQPDGSPLCVRDDTDSEGKNYFSVVIRD